jgi:hypothetical protein
MSRPRYVAFGVRETVMGEGEAPAWYCRNTLNEGVVLPTFVLGGVLIGGDAHDGEDRFGGNRCGRFDCPADGFV